MTSTRIKVGEITLSNSECSRVILWLKYLTAVQEVDWILALMRQCYNFGSAESNLRYMEQLVENTTQ